jgi:hypothetical protein
MRSIHLLLVGLIAVGQGHAQESLTPEQAVKALEACPVTAPPEVLYSAFSDFCLTHFGAEREPLVYGFSGKDLALLADGAWVNASENAAVIACESSLPATSAVDYGEDPAYGTRTTATDRPYYVHVHTLRDLKPGTTYHYRIELVDERKKVIRSQDATFTTPTRGKSIAVPAAGAAPPYRLDAAGATYVLTQDLTTPGTAIEVVGDDITLDLNGHTVRFAERAEAVVDGGIIVHGGDKARIRYQSSGFRLFNGAIVQGAGKALDANDDTSHFCPLVITGAGSEIAGLAIEYHGPQTWGMSLAHATGALRIHHNVLTDKGGIITNRHGSGTRSIGFVNTQPAENAFVIDHNLIRRTRQNGIGSASSIHNNEIYVDSCSTNSFAIQPNSAPGIKAGDLHHNRVFGTGFNAYGFGWAHESLRIHDNIVHFYGIMANSRWAATESWGDLSMLEGMRVTNYGKGGQVRNDLEYWNNLIVLRGGGGCELRGTGFYSDTTIKGLVFHDNTVKVISEDDKTLQVACISAQGHPDKPDALPVVYRDNTLISNLCHIRFGDSYGKGHNHRFIGNTLVREGKRPDYHAVAMGGGFSTGGHIILDCILGDGVSLLDPYWQKTGPASWYAVQWSLDLQAAAGDQVTVTDADGRTEFAGPVPADGRVRIPLTEAIIHPPTWPGGGEALALSGMKQEAKTPHRVTVRHDGVESARSVTMDKPQAIRF